MNSSQQPKRLIVLVGSPRRDGNSAALAQAVMAGAAEAGTEASLHFLDDYISGFLVDGRHAAPPADRYGELFLEHFLPADGVVFCTPLYWYGMSAQTKAFFDRSFSYYSNAYADAEQVHQRMSGKRIGLTVASEETYPGGAMGIVHQIQEFSRYSHCEFVGVVQGAGNNRGEVSRDPRNPLQAARDLGREIFTRHYSDYRMDTPRSTQVWQD
ncbi:Putative NAD(P)H-dependent FMN-containing oxidoreductase ywqN [Serratia quinivorans]|uniref:flavodoxin family protein n=1 Tax=Serratia quinivorans TaxID=137545 RepID=UPI0021771391|nr:NAD(P)H-dependent oxidoreductase [Serratia quinivorans]CAI0728374.1 Putative NAD(P)H-dependent FMN-containing oxidoreductase ywqN [Serratia quinivorans]CAI0751469.1 Putative NAD(P)H-dependent FMN-containing oxidoreductase ywqN [Serratia quinivorans]CAI1542603.1 Putative NAD(P)H-dependent FMN-containing oxidoreductase ywqN [Serratia quinivorans]CAI2043999.1 Putative NAD(P)H-dependent FMN-containing oxidoreductase ywqN [Serratia quinivorans]CAI2408577.1 Putative NAD(P)H-dependent FMN-containi